MRSRILRYFTAFIFAASLGGAVFSVATPQPAYAVCSDRLLTFPAWYRGVIDPTTCDVVSPSTYPSGLRAFIFKIALNIVEMMLQLVGYLSVAFIIRGGFKYILSTGTPDDIVKARKIILNAVVGLILSIFAIAIVNLVAGVF